MLSRFALLALCFASLFFCGESTNFASLKFFVQQPAIQKFQSLVNPILIAQLQNVSIPDQTISKLGINLYLTKIYLTGFNFSGEDVAFTPPNVISVKMSNIQAKALMNWEYKNFLIDLKGTAEDDISQMTVSFNIIFTSDGQGHASVKVGSLDVNIGSLNIHIYGPAGSFLSWIVNAISGLFLPLAEKAVQSAMTSAINNGLAGIFKGVPISLPFGPNAFIDYGLLPSTALWGMSGYHYDDNHFSSGQSPIYYSDLSHVSIDNYRSFDVSGYFIPPTSGQYSFQIHLTQRGLVEINGLSAGSLEMHNPGMCWPEKNTYTTGTADFDSDAYYPIRLRYQSGCGGGWVELNLCNSTGCFSIDPLYLNTQSTDEVPMTVSSTALEVSSFTTAHATNSPANNPFFSFPLPVRQTNPSSMFEVILGEFALNSVAYAATQAGYIHATISPNQVPPESPFQLNTTSMKFILPGLYAKYPDQQLNVSVSMASNDYPNISISSSSGFSLFVPIVTSFIVLTNPAVDAIDLGVNVSAVASASVVNNSLVAQVTSASLSLYVVSASVDVNIQVLQPFVSAIFEQVAIPLINQKLKQGFPIPVFNGLSLINPTITYGNHYIIVDTDFNYVPPTNQILEEIAKQKQQESPSVVIPPAKAQIAIN